MNNQATKSETAQKGPTRSFTELSMAGIELRGSAPARSAVDERKPIAGPEMPRYNERDLWLMAIGTKPITPENVARAAIPIRSADTAKQE